MLCVWFFSVNYTRQHFCACQKINLFHVACVKGSGPGYIHKALCADAYWDGSTALGGVRKLVQLDSSRDTLFRDTVEQSPQSSQTTNEDRCSTYRLVANEEGTLPFPTGTFDLVMSAVALHWVNDLPKLFSEIRRVLKPDGCFLLAMIGGSTLPELRASMVLAEMERDGGVSPHIGPFCQLSDVGALMQAAGFALPTIDIDTIHLGYPHAMVVMEHLQRMGEANASLKRKPRTSRDTFLAAACLYDHLFSATATADVQHDAAVMVEATVQVIYAIGWSPHASQPKPKARGSATHKVGSMVEHHVPTSSSL
jgi:NADH dehydrogenase [ubiquinone] 1 alpha subcomplex assembly factor 5